MLKIGMDISQLAHTGGVGVYTQNLADNLDKNKNIDLKFFYSSLRKPYKGLLNNVKSYPLPPTIFEFLFNKLRFIPIEYFIGDIDVFHSSDWIQPPTKAKKITTFHDVVPLKFPYWSTPKIVNVHKRRLNIVEEEIDKVIAVSEATKKDLVELTNIPKEKIVVIYEGVGEEFKKISQEKVEEFRKRYSLPDNFILAVGGIGERRNLKRIEEVTKDYNLVITGKTIPYLLKEEMPLLYSAATLLLYPSLYEGFGLPILEAQKCGIPVITSNVSSMPEVAGEGALYVDPLDENSIKNKLNILIKDLDLQKDLIKKGLRNVEKFSWEKCAKETTDVYMQLKND